jgi:hypothetical protein
MPCYTSMEVCIKTYWGTGGIAPHILNLGREQDKIVIIYKVNIQQSVKKPIVISC